MDIYNLSVIAFFIVIAVLLYIDRKKVEHKHLVLFMRRTKRFGKLIDDIAKIAPRFWKALYSFAILVGVLAMLYGMFMVGTASYKIVTGELDGAAAKFILPSFSSEESVGEYSINIPFWTWILVIILILVPHELSHGIAARAEKVRLHSVGVMLLAFFPGAFVEPDEIQLAKKKLATRLRVFSAGTFANFTIALLAILLLIFIVFPYLFVSGVQIVDVEQGSPAAAVGLTNQTILTEINSQPIEVSYTEFAQGQGYFIDEIGQTEIGQVIEFKDNQGKTYEVTLGENDSEPYLGIFYTPVQTENSFWTSIADFLTKLWMFSFAVGIFNMLPLGPLDGGLVFAGITDKYLGKKAKKIQKAVSIITLLLVLFMFFGPNLMG